MPRLVDEILIIAVAAVENVAKLHRVFRETFDLIFRLPDVHDIERAACAHRLKVGKVLLFSL
ncbi:hypothetical protein D3C71_2113530 [compost metagenome]